MGAARAIHRDALRKAGHPQHLPGLLRQARAATARPAGGTTLAFSGYRRYAMHDQPVQPELPGRLGGFHEVHRLAPLAVHTEAVAIDDATCLYSRRQDHYEPLPWTLG